MLSDLSNLTQLLAAGLELELESPGIWFCPRYRTLSSCNSESSGSHFLMSREGSNLAVLRI